MKKPLIDPVERQWNRRLWILLYASLPILLVGVAAMFVSYGDDPMIRLDRRGRGIVGLVLFLGLSGVTMAGAVLSVAYLHPWVQRRRNERHPPPTRGKVIAAKAVLPTKLAELMNAQAEVLERDIRPLDLTDANAGIQTKAYAQLIREHREIAVALDKLARQMAGCRDLPMAEHRLDVANLKAFMESFRQFVHIERELVKLLRARLKEDQRFVSK